MSGADGTDGSSLPDSLRTVTPPSGTHPDAEMGAFGWLIFLGLLVLLLPVLPILAVIWLLDRARGSLGL
ncbi:hypothetical protein BRC96_05355 [Halobacteriales archaeon QS_6_64_34]|nr:MAG: hypothetical protein BRC96_05355 [Halobacteriales archaeon QS_6_64_34]